MAVNNRSIIRKIRKLRGISQNELGELIGSQSMISRIENGLTSPTDRALQQICDVLNVPVSDYFETVFGKKKQLSAVKNRIRASIY
ncbi:helix-turn-helix domain-containing protein [Leuconostoc sp. MS02]|uniref:Helix-turn-helix domain-containing protein n=1 Tax=Leuconostoc aquikimchii TaxID=3236804 RepID=A0ABV3S2V5_9LACO